MTESYDGLRARAESVERSLEARIALATILDFDLSARETTSQGFHTRLLSTSWFRSRDTLNVLTPHDSEHFL
jgi:hypothetical protein